MEHLSIDDFRPVRQILKKCLPIICMLQLSSSDFEFESSIYHGDPSIDIGVLVSNSRDNEVQHVGMKSH